MNWLKHARINGKLILPYNEIEKEKFQSGKRALELLGVPHEVGIENVVLNEEDSKTLFVNLGISLDIFEKDEIFLKDMFNDECIFKSVKGKKGLLNNSKTVLDIINDICEFEIKDKAGDFIGTRMGRPEKAKLRKLTGSPNVLFPVGNEGGRFRSVQAACDVGSVKSSFPIRFCDVCKREGIYTICEECGAKCRKMYFFYDTNEKSFEKKIEESEKEGRPFCNQSLDVVHYFKKARERLGMNKYEVPSLIKGVRGMSSDEKQIEHLCKGILRAKYDLQVNKDGTIRFDATELPIVCFKPKEIFVSVEKLRELGYDKDVNGRDLVHDEQVLELMPHDIILPCCNESPDEKADDVFVRICKFVDDLLTKFYGLRSFYNVKKRDDLIGKMGVFIAPHNCAGVICRFIGFSNTQGLFASPYMHAAVRRDCDGDEAAVMLLGDVLLNFSRKYLPSHRGGNQDAPLVLNAKIDAGEVDDQILDFELVSEYPLELYRLSEKREHSSEIKINSVKNILKQSEDPFVNVGYTHDTKNFNDGVGCSSYKLLANMNDKVGHQMRLVEKLRGVDTADTARLMIERHFIRDVRGNLRKFSMQSFRCVTCNGIIRRPPLSGVCLKCGGKLIFTINEGGIKKYLELALSLAEKYNLSDYMKQNLDLIKRYIESIFGKEKEKQTGLDEFF
jgi:DNA polymerase II large subunit